MQIHCKYDALVPVGELKPYPKNRNQHPPEQIARLAKLLAYQGVRAPIVVSRLSGCIAKGHGTLSAIKANGWTEAPVVYQDFADETVEYAFVQSDNTVASWAEMDLSGINHDIGDLGPEFDVELLGLKNFLVDAADRELIERINKGDENSEWVGMPEFDPKNKEPKLVLIFETEEQRNNFISDHNVVITSKLAQTWTSRI
jgi:hypothetical protein